MAVAVAGKTNTHRKCVPPHNKNSYIQLSVNATLSEYDAQDRVTKVTLPDGSVSETKYGITELDGKRHYVEEQTDPLGNVGVRYSDPPGNIQPDSKYGKLLLEPKKSKEYFIDLLDVW